MTEQQNELVFVPLGGVGEIGMNMGLYGFGPEDDRTWLMVDCGISFPGPDTPGVDVIMADPRFIEEERTKLAGIVLTHAHEDHYGALVDLWPRLRAPVYASAFSIGLLQAKLVSEFVKEEPELITITPGKTIDIGPFSVELVPVTHSIPEAFSIAIRTALGLVVHSGDWKIDPDPVLGNGMDIDRLKELGQEGVTALICDSTNANTEGRSGSEGEVAKGLLSVMKEAEGRIAVTTFASNVARIQSIALAAQACGRDVVIIGRSLHRYIEVAKDCGYLQGLPPFLDQEAYDSLPRRRVVAICTGSQGENRAAMARIAGDAHRVKLAKGDTVIFSSKTIPGNERDVSRVMNQLARAGMHLITEKDAIVHASGHPRREELAEFYSWLKPQALVPVHGEPVHLASHADFARKQGIAKVETGENGTMFRLAPGPLEVIDEAPADVLFRDGRLIRRPDESGMRERRKLAFVGHVAVSVVLNRRGEVIADPEVSLTGLPEADDNGTPMDIRVYEIALGTLESIPRARRKDVLLVREAIRRSVRASVHEIWGKKPVCSTFVALV